MQQAIRRIAAAIGVALATVLIFCAPVHTQQPVRTPSEAPNTKEQQPGETNDGKDAPGRRAAPTQTIIIETPEQAAHSEERERRADQHEADDLQAQRDAANGAQRAAASAERQEVAAIAQVVTAIVSVLAAISAIWISLIAARRSERVAIQELRAYVGMEKSSIVAINSDGSATVTLTFKNFGQTPAKNVSVGLIVGWRQMPLDELSFVSNAGPAPNQIISNATMFPGVVQTTTLGCGPSQGALAAFGTGQIALVVFGTIKYIDTFGAEQATNVRLVGSVAFPPNTLRHFSSGNDST